MIWDGQMVGNKPRWPHDELLLLVHNDNDAAALAVGILRVCGCGLASDGCQDKTHSFASVYACGEVAKRKAKTYFLGEMNLTLNQSHRESFYTGKIWYLIIKKPKFKKYMA